MSSPAQDLRYVLEADSSLDLSFGTNLFVGEMQNSLASAVVLLDTGGYSPDPGPYYKPTLQVIVRAASGEYASGYTLAESIRSCLHEYTGQPDSSTMEYTGVWSIGDPMYLGTDESGRPLFSLNFRIHRR